MKGVFLGDDVTGEIAPQENHSGFKKRGNSGYWGRGYGAMNRFQRMMKELQRFIYNIALFLSVSVNTSHTEVPPIIGVIRSDTTYSSFGYRIVPLGDQNGDGFADFMTWDAKASAYVFHGGNPISGEITLRIDSIQPPIGMGDMNGDGYADVAAPGLSTPKRKLNFYFGGPSIDSARDSWFGPDSLRAFTPAVFYRNGSCGDSTRLFTWAYDQKSVFVRTNWTKFDTLPNLVLRPSWFQQPGFAFGEAMAIGDFNGDGHPDLVTNFRPSEQYQLKGEICAYWGACALDTIPDMKFTQAGPWTRGKVMFGRVLENIGDVNGDGYPDLFVGHDNSPDSVSFVYFGGPTFDSLPDLILPDYTETGKLGQDLNGDHIDDFLTSLAIQSSSYSYVNVYYGGATVDSIPDLRISVSEMPEYLIIFGREIAGVGDVNGDGASDFAVSAQDQFGHGVIYIFSGKKAPSDVPVDDLVLPSDLTLHQNYPNPFNPSTTIEFELVKPARAVVRVYNTLGEVVRTLVDRQLAVGTHRVVWDGRDDQGREVASGVYLYRLTAGGLTQEKKMVLVR